MAKPGRRKFIEQSAKGMAAFMIVPRYVLGGKGYTAPSDRINIAAIGVGGKGESNIRHSIGWDEKTGETQENLVALCDVDEEVGAVTFDRFPKVKRFKDFRVMLEAMEKDIDAVIVSTPDNTHAVAAMAAMKLGKHVYVEKPLTHDIYEARMLTEAARKYNVITQMGNQGSSGDGVRLVCEWIWSGVIGRVREVHTWTNRPVWPQGQPRPTEKVAVPKTLDWDLWLGPAPKQDYHPSFVPFNWRGWWDFGTGALGDMACHVIDPAFRALKLKYPIRVEASTVVQYRQMWTPSDFPESCPQGSIIHIDFPAREDMPEVTLHWYDGGLMPRRPAELKDGEDMSREDGGILMIGDNGKILCDMYGANPRLLPTELMKDFKAPDPWLPRVTVSHQRNWVEAIKGGPAPSSNFDYAGPFTETVLMGNLALRSHTIKEGDEYTGRKPLLWDGENMRITNYEPANQFVRREYRNGWSL
ncbi:MAG TPA: Gfo/Idh/MocA family oxidoreductase [Saprospiraceae bacterium]|nr:Gfo/Idh/MocA family oxidoreductase [Saprospiraceae bacterium]HMQ85223.1 Gfo/Idh/MocA family oxidoreductase [Saprospiraceae bacterium]